MYRADAVLHETDATIVGIEAISAKVGRLLVSMPDGFRFEMSGDPSAHHGLAIARWQGGPPGTAIVTGSDVARIVDGRIAELHVFLDAK